MKTAKPTTSPFDAYNCLVAQARSTALGSLGRHDEAHAELARFSEAELVAASGASDDDVLVIDLAADDAGVADDGGDDGRGDGVRDESRGGSL